MMYQGRIALTLSLALSRSWRSGFTAALGGEKPRPFALVAATTPSERDQPPSARRDLAAIPDGITDLSQLRTPDQRMIGEHAWHTDYDAAYRQAEEEHKMLLLFFRDDAHPWIAGYYERDVLSSKELEAPLSKVVRVVLPLDTLRPFRAPELPDLEVLRHSSFKYMYGRQGIAMIDLTEPGSDLHGCVVSAHPFTPGKHYTARATKIVLGLPKATVTQRALIYAVRLHPAAPISTTDGQCTGYMCKQARQSSNLMAAYGSVGHHDWGTRYGEIAASTGKSAMEVAAMSGNRSMIEAAIEVVDQWYGSPAHWGIMSSPAAIFGYDLVHDAASNT